MVLVVLEFIGLLPLLLVVALVYAKRRALARDDRRDPLTVELRHLPGAGLQVEQDQGNEARIDHLVIVIIAGLLGALAMAGLRVPADSLQWRWSDGLILAIMLGVGMVYGRRITAALPHMRNLRLGLRAEQAAAQELGATIAGNNRLLHDIRAKDFNIDHVVITPAGIFAVETKSRLKPPAGMGPEAVKVRYNGNTLQFPGWTESKPIEQASRQARWLRDHLRQATGENFPVFPVLALPGWYVENTARITDDMVRVVNPKNCHWLLVPDKRPPRLAPEAIQRAAFAIEKLATAGAS